MALAEWIERVEGSIADEDMLHVLGAEAEADTTLNAHDRAQVIGRVERYLESFDDMRAGKLVSAAEFALGGPVLDDDVPDFDLGDDDRSDSPLSEALAEVLAEAVWEERLHPRNRLGKWIEKLRKLGGAKGLRERGGKAGQAVNRRLARSTLVAMPPLVLSQLHTFLDRFDAGYLFDPEFWTPGPSPPSTIYGQFPELITWLATQANPEVLMSLVHLIASEDQAERDEGKALIEAVLRERR